MAKRSPNSAKPQGASEQQKGKNYPCFGAFRFFQLFALPFIARESIETDKKIAKLEPLNAQVVSVSAVAKFRVKGDVFANGFPPDGFATISFLKGTNVSDKVPSGSLRAEGSDFFFGRLPEWLLLNLKDLPRDECEIVINFHQGDPVNRPFVDNWRDKKAEFLSSVGVFAISTYPDVGTNVQVLEGTVFVTVNSSLSWTFPIPRQRQKFGMMTCRIWTNVAGKIEGDVKPVPIADVTGQTVGFFDGK